MSVDLEANKALIRRHFRALGEGDVDAFAATHASGGRNHAAGPFDSSVWPPEGKPFGPAEARETFDWLRGMSPDLTVEIEDLLAEGDQVVAWIRMTGTRPGGPVDFRHAHRFRVRDGLVVEHWAVRDDLLAMVQSGVVTPPGRPPG